MTEFERPSNGQIEEWLAWAARVPDVIDSAVATEIVRLLKHERDRADAASSFANGWKYQAEKFEAELPPCDGMCTPASGPEEDCSRHGRKPAELWAMLLAEQKRADGEQALREAAVGVAQTYLAARDRAEAIVDAVEAERDRADRAQLRAGIEADWYEEAVGRAIKAEARIEAVRVLLDAWPDDRWAHKSYRDRLRAALDGEQ